MFRPTPETTLEEFANAALHAGEVIPMYKHSQDIGIPLICLFCSALSKRSKCNMGRDQAAVGEDIDGFTNKGYKFQSTLLGAVCVDFEPD